MARDIEDRTFRFAERIVNMSRSLPKTIDGRVVASQVLRSGTSVGANVEEAQAAHTKREFAMKMAIALKESRETHYWLRLIRSCEMLEASQLDEMINEADELRRILGSIVSKARGKSKSQ